MSQEYAQCDIKVIVDYAQERGNRLGPFTFATDGTQVDNGSRVNCIIDPVTLSTFGTPLPMTNEWLGAGTAATGNYYRFQKSDFTFVDSSKWKQQDVLKEGNSYIFCSSGSTVDMQSVVSLTGGVDRNVPLYFSFRKNKMENQDDKALTKLYWSNTNNKDKDVQLHFNSDGSCAVYRGYVRLLGTVEVSSAGTGVTGVNTLFQDATYGLSAGNVIYDDYGRLIGTVSSVSSDTSLTLTGNAANNFIGQYFITGIRIVNDLAITGPAKVANYSRTENSFNKLRPPITVINPNDKFNDVYIIPCRGKELMVLTSYGLNFSYSFPDLNVPDPPANNSIYNAQIAPTDPPNYSSQPIILPSGSLSIQVSQGKVSWQLAKLNFLTNWSITSQEIKLPSPPPPLPSYKNGLISCAFGSTEVTGIGSSFTTQLSTGDRLYWYQDTNTVESILLGTIDTVNTDTSLYLEQPTEYKVTDSFNSIDQKLTGTISFTAGNGAITGTGTSFSSQLSLLDTIWDSDGNYIGLISGIINNSSLVVDKSPGFGATSIAYWKNLNQYVNRFENAQAEFFSAVVPANTDNLTLSYYITNSDNNLTSNSLSTTDLFNNSNTKFKIKIVQTNEDDGANLASADKGFMFYSLDDVYVLGNEKTYAQNTDITTAIESLDISRTEEGAYNLSFSARKKELEDLGMDRPFQIANRPIKVVLSPRRQLLTGEISYVGTGGTLTGTGTSFSTELFNGSSIYLADGTFIGIATTINSNTNAGFWSYDNNTYINEDFSNQPKGDDFTLYEGYLSSPEITYLQSGYEYAYAVPTYEEYSLLNFTAIDKLAHLNKYYYSEAPNFDNKNLENIFETNIVYGGAGNNDPQQKDLTFDYTIRTYQVPINRNNSAGQYNYVADLGTTCGGFLEKLRSDLAQNFTFFCRPDWYPNNLSQNGWSNFSGFRLLDQNFIPYDVLTYDLFLSPAIAESLFSIPQYDGWKNSIRSLRRTFEAPEANRIFIIGLDKTDGARLQYLKQDLDSQNPYLSPEDRPTNWLGDIAPFVMINDKLNCETDVEQAGKQFYNKLSPGRNIIEFESDLITAWDPSSKYTPDNRENLSGQISASGGNITVTGTSTAFLTEVQVGDFLYLENGNKVGYVRSIETDFSLTLVTGSFISTNGSKFYNDYTQYLDQYRYFDIGDIVNLYDEYGNVVYYRILSWDCSFQKETVNQDSINVRRAVYRAKQVDYSPATSPDPNGPVFAFNFQQVPAINQWIVTQGLLLDFKVLALDSNYDNVIYSITNAPSGMTINSSTGQITWTPTSLQQNQIYSGITVNAFDGTNNTEYFFTVRTYDSI